jgi:hypothetical protein
MGTLLDPTSPTALTRRLDQELALVQGAIRMVGDRGMPSVTIGGLRFGEEVIQELAAEAARARVTLVPLWHLGSHGCDVRAERQA